MANLNTIAAYTNFNPSPSSPATAQRNVLQPIKVGTTVETVFTVGTNTLGTYVAAVLSIPVQAPATANQGVLGSGTGITVGSNPALLVNQYGAYSQIPNNLGKPYFTSDSFNGRAFKVRAQGTFTSGVASNDLQIALYLGTSATVGSDLEITSVTTGTSGNFGAVSGNFILEALLIWDLTTAKVNGLITDGVIGPYGIAGTLATQAATTQVAAAAITNLNFVCSAKWNAANSGNVVNLTEFAIDLN